MNSTADKIKHIKHEKMKAFDLFNQRQEKINKAIQNFESSQVNKRGK